MELLTDNMIRQTGEAVLTYSPLPAMGPFHRSPAKFRWLLGGNRPIHYRQLVLMADGTKKSMADLCVGDYVLGYDRAAGSARPTRVLAKFNTGLLDCYKVGFSDGGSVRAAGLHPFPVRARSGKTYTTHGIEKPVKLVDVTINDLIPRLKNSVSKRPRMISPVETHYKAGGRLPIDPYALGVLLGDGSINARETNRSISITSPDPEIVERAIKGIGTLVGKVKRDKYKDKCPTYRMVGSRPLKGRLDRLGLLGTKSGTKFIPLMYMCASVEDRAQLLSGLIDTDGSEDEFTSKSEKLASGFAVLIRSLGGKATLKPSRKCCCNTGVWGDYWRVYWRLERRLPLCLPRKQRKLTKKWPDYTNRIIRAIEPLGKCRTCCISIGHPDHCFLLDGFVATCNSGKTHALIYDMVCFALKIHPWRITPGNATIWCCSETWSQGGKIIWAEKLQGQQLLPAASIQGIVWHNKAQNIPKELRLHNGVTIEFLAFSQGRDLFQGRSVDAMYNDEQCHSGAEEIFQEQTARLIDSGGFLAWSMTPIRYQAWLETRIKNPKKTDSVHFANLLDNKKSRGGHIADDQIDLMVSEWPAEIRATRIEGRFAAFTGQIYKIFNRETHVIPAFPIPDDWSLFRSIDLGFAVPFCCLWLARDHDRRWYIFDEHYESQQTLFYHSEIIKQKSGSSRYRMTFSDWDGQDRHELKRLGIETVAADKDIRLGIESVQRCLQTQADGKPRLFVFSHCTNLIREMLSYRWQEGSELRDGRDAPLKLDDHAADALRYGIHSIEGR